MKNIILIFILYSVLSWYSECKNLKHGDKIKDTIKDLLKESIGSSILNASIQVRDDLKDALEFVENAIKHSKNCSSCIFNNLGIDHDDIKNDVECNEKNGECEKKKPNKNMNKLPLISRIVALKNFGKPSKNKETGQNKPTEVKPSKSKPKASKSKPVSSKPIKEQSVPPPQSTQTPYPTTQAPTPPELNTLPNTSPSTSSLPPIQTPPPQNMINHLPSPLPQNTHPLQTTPPPPPQYQQIPAKVPVTSSQSIPMTTPAQLAPMNIEQFVGPNGQCLAPCGLSCAPECSLNCCQSFLMPNQPSQLSIGGAGNSGCLPACISSCFNFCPPQCCSMYPNSKKRSLLIKSNDAPKEEKQETENTD